MKKLIFATFLSTSFISCTPSGPVTNAGKTTEAATAVKVLAQKMNVQATTFELDLKLNADVICMIEYGVTKKYGEWLQTSSIYSKDHVLSLSGLQPNTTYYYRVSFMGDDNANPIIVDKQFKTLSNEIVAENDQPRTDLLD